MFRIFALAAVLTLAAIAPASAQKAGSSLVVVELFTSQGCAACPPADKVLTRLSKDENLLVLSWPVDYWDYLGWTDTFADEANTRRQEDYNHSLGQKGVYTPQMIINGREQTVGSREAEVRDIVARQKAGQVLDVNVSLTQTGDSLSIEVKSGNIDRPAIIWLLLFDSASTVDIRFGDNRSRSLHYTNIVRRAINAGSWDGGELLIPIDWNVIRESGVDCIAVLIQDGKTGPILGATKLVLADLN